MSDDILKVINNLRSLRAFAKELDMESLLEFQEKLNTVIQERQKEEEEAKQEELKKRETLERLRTQIAEAGINPEEVANFLTNTKTVTKVKSVRKKRTPKYEYLDSNGELRQWTGQGRHPQPISEAIKNEGKKLEDFLIKKETPSSSL
ncbi:H-NS histone family protein [Yersinia enterocolitica]|uniref:H-NS family histone-like protein n=1 Tax=Yersinia TaxID=629 RepID=UPI0005E6074A|nr:MULTISPECIES: H-NS family nucleoid-associated regulatory protein [Yersinia]MCW6576383.1 H-NS histone family protein [Yersinia ruckeri]CND60797.1 DNA-binding protein H-NS [Yersinia pseudotuberculosis]CQH79908.1 DNA-binding protein H-NS [Yersinia enterocolitica]HDL6887703.1 H-NS histone family protein [Yersinia enterocolitica]HDL6901057.1 H-NS histone family protein [Yersinia enterocolitica]